MASGLTQRGPAEQVPRRRRQPLPDRLGQSRVAATGIPDRREPAAQRAGQPPRPRQGQVTRIKQAEAPVSQLINDFGPPVASPSAARQRAAIPFVHLKRELKDNLLRPL
jgi:hypothetical protein